MENDNGPFSKFLKRSREIHDKRYPGSTIDDQLFKLMAKERWENASDEMKRKFTDTEDSPPKPQQVEISPFMKYVRAKRSEVLAENPHLPPSEAMALISNSWKSMSNAEKAEYNLKSE